MPWENVQCALNHTHRVYIQAKTDECAIACAAMVLQRLGHGEVDLADLRQASQDHKGGYRPSTQDAGAKLDAKSLGVRSAMANIMTGHFGGGTIGTLTGENLPELLQAQGVSHAVAVSATDGDNLRSTLKNASNSRLYVLRVAWDAGGGHAVLVDRHTSRFGAGRDQFCVCDPGQGVVVVTFSKVSAPPAGSSGISNREYGEGHVRLQHVQAW